MRFVIRGKRDRGVPVLLHRELLDCIELILQFRKQAGVSDTNPYVFGISGATNHKHLFANSLIRYYSLACGAKRPTLIRGTLLRKHIATQSAIFNL